MRNEPAQTVDYLRGFLARFDYLGDASLRVASENVLEVLGAALERANR